MKIIKRSGSEDIFDAAKIVAAIRKANDSVLDYEKLTADQIEEIASNVETACENMKRSPSVEEIQDMVENQLMNKRAFGPAIMLSLFWKRFNFKGAVAGIITGAAVDILWYAFLTSTGIYELLPGFVLGLIVAVVVTLCTNEPSKEVYELFDKAEKFDE